MRCRRNRLIFDASYDEKRVSPHATGAALIRTSRKELLPPLDPDQFRPIQHATVVNLRRVQAALRGDSGQFPLRRRGRPEPLPVNRVHAQLLRPM